MTPGPTAAETANEQRRARAGTNSPTRASLLQAARGCVTEYGLAGATSRRIAERAGANLGAITYYFGSKDGLLAEALFGELESKLDPVMTILGDQSRPAVARLMQAVRELAAEFDRSADDVPTYLNALVLSTESRALADRAQRMFEQLGARLADAIEELRSDGAIEDWVEPVPMSFLLIAAANGIALHSRLLPEGSPVGELAGQMAGLLLASSRHRIS